MPGEYQVWTYAPVRVQQWENAATGQRARVEIDEYDLCEVTISMLSELMKSAGWQVASEFKLRPVA